MNTPSPRSRVASVLFLAVATLGVAHPGHASAIRGAREPEATALGVSPQASAAQPASQLATEVMVLHATNRPNGAIDPAIGALPALRQPPFSSYNNYQLISRTRYPLEKAAPATSTLPNGRVLQIILREVVDTRFRVATSINQPGGTTFLPLLEVTTPAGEPFFVAGQSYQDGILVIGITVVR